MIGRVHPKSSRTDYTKIDTTLKLVELFLDTGNMALLEPFMSRLVSNSPNLKQRFEVFLLPLFPLLKATLDARRVPVTQHPFSLFFRMCISIYINIYMGPPPPPRSARAITPPSPACRDCEDCKHLDTLLRDPDDRTWSLSAVQARRIHVQRRLGNAGLPITLETLRDRSPHTLQVTKRWGGWQGDLEAFQEKRDRGKAFVRKLGNEETICELLAKDYESVMNAFEDRPRPPPAKTHNSGAAAGGVPAQAQAARSVLGPRPAQQEQSGDAKRLRATGAVEID